MSNRYANSVNNRIITALNDRCATKLLLSGNTGAYRNRAANNKPFKISHDNGFLYAFVSSSEYIHVCVHVNVSIQFLRHFFFLLALASPSW